MCRQVSTYLAVYRTDRTKRTNLRWVTFGGRKYRLCLRQRFFSAIGISFKILIYNVLLFSGKTTIVLSKINLFRKICLKPTQKFL